jgi:hypothetical protein
MTVLYVTEFRSAGHVGPATVQAPRIPSLGTQTVAIAATSTQTATAFRDDTSLVRLAARADCHVIFGTNPTATTSSMFMPSGSVEYFDVPPGSALKVAVRGV